MKKRLHLLDSVRFLKKLEEQQSSIDQATPPFFAQGAPFSRVDDRGTEPRWGTEPRVLAMFGSMKPPGSPNHN